MDTTSDKTHDVPLLQVEVKRRPFVRQNKKIQQQDGAQVRQAAQSVLGLGLFGPKWTEKWVHLDGTILKCFPMVVEQQLFSLGSSHRNRCIQLMDYKFVVANEKKYNRKYVFQLESIEKSSKAVTFACSSEKELAEWKYALTLRLCLPADAQVSPVVAEKIRRAAEAFAEVDPRHTGKVEVKKLYGLLRTVGWEGKESEFALMQQQLDFSHRGVITRTRLLTWLQSYYGAQEVMVRVNAERLSHQVVADLPCKLVPQCEESILSKLDTRVAASKRLVYEELINWNQRYHAFLSHKPSDIFAAGLQVSTFLTKFRHTAELFVSEIVAELVLNDSEKTFPPQSLANDEIFATDGVFQYNALHLKLVKFQRDGLLVYLCVDHPTSRGISFEKQDLPSVAIFHKMVGHQVRAARMLQEAIEKSTSAKQLQVPLQCCVDYLGFRAFVIASSESMVKSTRQHLFELATSEKATQLDEQLKAVLDHLGLLASDSNDGQSTSIDVRKRIDAFYPLSAGFAVKSWENSSVYQLHNLVDVVPPDIMNRESDAFPPDNLLYKVRPEFVRMQGCNLSFHSDNPVAGAHGQRQDHQDPVKLKASLTACECLHTLVIPAFVADLENGRVQVIDSRSLTRALHGEGINVRYLASCYELASLKHIRRLLLVEMVARACKAELRASLQRILLDDTVKQTDVLRHAEACDSMDGPIEHDKADAVTARALAKLALQEVASHVTVEFFNLVLGGLVADSRTFWESRLLPQLRAKFGISRESFDLDTLIHEDLLHLPMLFHAMQFQTNVNFVDQMKVNLKGLEPLTLECLQTINPNTSLVARTTSECESFVQNSDVFVAASDFKSALSSCMFHISILDTAPDDERTLSLCHLLTCVANILFAMKLGLQAERLAVLAIEESRGDHAELSRAYTVLMKLKHLAGDVAGAREVFPKALEPIQWHLGPTHPLLCDAYMTMIDILCDAGEFRPANKLMLTCASLVRDSFGKTSLLFADIRRQQGQLMDAADPPDVEATIAVLEDALAIYERHFHDPVEDVPVYKDFAAECCYLLANLHKQVSGSQALEIAYGIALRGLALRKEVPSTSHYDIMKSYLQLGSLSQDLGELYRAIEYYRPALSIVKSFQHDEHTDLIRSITQTMLQLHLETLSVDKQSIIEKTPKRYAQQWSQFALLLNGSDAHAASDGEVSDESALLTFVTKQLFQLDPVAYVDNLIEKTELEYQDYKQYNFNLTGTLPQHQMVRSSSDRLVPFGTFSPPGSPRRPVSPIHHSTLLPSSSSTSRIPTTFNQSNDNVLKTATGDFTFGAQLAALLVLIGHYD